MNRRISLTASVWLIAILALASGAFGSVYGQQFPGVPGGQFNPNLNPNFNPNFNPGFNPGWQGGINAYNPYLNSAYGWPGYNPYVNPYMQGNQFGYNPYMNWSPVVSRFNWYQANPWAFQNNPWNAQFGFQQFQQFQQGGVGQPNQFVPWQPNNDLNNFLQRQQQNIQRQPARPNPQVNIRGLVRPQPR